MQGVSRWCGGREGCVIDSILIPSNITPNDEAKWNGKLEISPSPEVAAHRGDAARRAPNAKVAHLLSTFSRCSLSCIASKEVRTAWLLRRAFAALSNPSTLPPFPPPLLPSTLGIPML